MVQRRAAWTKKKSNGKNKNKIWGHYRVHLEHSFRIHSFSKHSDFTVKCYRQYPFHQKVAPMVQYILHLYIFNRERERGREGERESGRRACMHACIFVPVTIKGGGVFFSIRVGGGVSLISNETVKISLHLIFFASSFPSL